MCNNNMGSISSGTMLPEDLIPTFTFELLRMRGISRAHRARARAIESACEEENYYEGDDVNIDLESLFDMLECYAPEFFYFGSHPGDGADYGYWLSEEWAQQLEDDDGLRVGDTSEIPAEHVGLVAVVNDHGNVTLYRRGRNHRLYEIWSIV